MRIRTQYRHRVLSFDSSQEKTYQSQDMLQPPAPKKQKNTSLEHMQKNRDRLLTVCHGILEHIDHNHCVVRPSALMRPSPVVRPSGSRAISSAKSEMC
jgi:hypothetical protein